MNGDFAINIAEIMKNVETAEVVSFYFPLLRRTLLIDNRYDAEQGPMIKLVPMVNSIEERFRSLRRLRPRLRRPESMTIIPWPKYVASLTRLGIWDKIVQRLQSTGYPEAAIVCNHILDELLQLERQEVANAIIGNHYYSLWERKR